METASALSAARVRRVDALSKTTSGAGSSVLEELSDTFAAARRAIFSFLDLLSPEARRAAMILMWMMAWGAFTAMLVLTAWLVFLGALAYYAVSLGVPWPIAAAVIVLINLLAATIAIRICVQVSRDLLFPATRR